MTTSGRSLGRCVAGAVAAIVAGAAGCSSTDARTAIADIPSATAPDAPVADFTATFLGSFDVATGRLRLDPIASTSSTTAVTKGFGNLAHASVSFNQYGAVYNASASALAIPVTGWSGPTATCPTPATGTANTCAAVAIDNLLPVGLTNVVVEVTSLSDSTNPTSSTAFTVLNDDSKYFAGGANPKPGVAYATGALATAGKKGLFTYADQSTSGLTLGGGLLPATIGKSGGESQQGPIWVFNGAAGDNFVFGLRVLATLQRTGYVTSTTTQVGQATPGSYATSDFTQFDACAGLAPGDSHFIVSSASVRGSAVKASNDSMPFLFNIYDLSSYWDGTNGAGRYYVTSNGVLSLTDTTDVDAAKMGHLCPTLDGIETCDSSGAPGTAGTGTTACTLPIASSCLEGAFSMPNSFYPFWANLEVPESVAVTGGKDHNIVPGAGICWKEVAGTPNEVLVTYRHMQFAKDTEDNHVDISFTVRMHDFATTTNGDTLDTVDFIYDAPTQNYTTFKAASGGAACPWTTAGVSVTNSQAGILGGPGSACLTAKSSPQNSTGAVIGIQGAGTSGSPSTQISCGTDFLPDPATSLNQYPYMVTFTASSN